MEIPYSTSFDQSCLELELDKIREESSSHRPKVTLQLRHTHDTLHGRYFIYQDRFMRSDKFLFQDMVCEDSCVELFLQPSSNPNSPYLTLEMSCNGKGFLSYLITDPTRTETGFKEYYKLDQAQGHQIQIQSSLNDSKITSSDSPQDWSLSFSLPLKLIQDVFLNHTEHKDSNETNPRLVSNSFAGAGNWRLNAFKCADKSAKPHWLSVFPVPEWNFHEPAAFGEISFGPN